MNTETTIQLPKEETLHSPRTKIQRSLPKYVPVIVQEKKTGTAKVIGKRWAGPRGKLLSGTAKQRARLEWDKQRFS